MDCNALTDPANGQVDDSAGTTFGQNATYSCITGYNLVGDNTRTCEATGNWSGSAPTCERMFFISASYQVCQRSELHMQMYSSFQQLWTVAH